MIRRAQVARGYTLVEVVVVLVVLGVVAAGFVPVMLASRTVGEELGAWSSLSATVDAAAGVHARSGLAPAEPGCDAAGAGNLVAPGDPCAVTVPGVRVVGSATVSTGPTVVSLAVGGPGPALVAAASTGGREPMCLVMVWALPSGPTRHARLGAGACTAAAAVAALEGAGPGPAGNRADPVVL